MRTIDLGTEYVLNCCAKFLARSWGDARHNDGQYPAGDPRGFIAEAWRFPVVDAWADGTNFVACYGANSVTFVYTPVPAGPAPGSVAVVGTFATLYETIPLSQVAGTPYWAVSLLLPKGRCYTYRYMVDGMPTLDPINPQRTTLDNGKQWSRVFTQLCMQPVTLEDWEQALLARITNRIVPFHTDAGKNFLQRYYDSMGDAARDTQMPTAYRLDEPVGVVNFIDKLLAREEAHRLVDYRLCLRQIDSVLRQRDPYTDPAQMPDDVYDGLYNQMAADNVPGWDTTAYASPAFFLKLLRRHTFEGAFSHPKYGGNVGAAGWAYLEDHYTGTDGQTLFNWRRIMEPPLGQSTDYRG